MTNRVQINNIDHHDLRAIAVHAAEYGDAINQALIFPNEFEEAQREYPIFFSRDEDGALRSVALLGLDAGENLFLGEQGWQARYVPAVQRRGPFSIALQPAEGDAEPQAMIMVDLDDPRVGKEQGQPLFLPHGGNSPYLDHIADALRTLYEGLELNKAMFATFQELDLVVPIAVEVMVSEEVRYDIPHFLTVNQDRLAQLAGADLERLHRSGFLRIAFLAAASLNNVSHLAELKRRTRR
jgi:hypothetical protein